MILEDNKFNPSIKYPCHVFFTSEVEDVKKTFEDEVIKDYGPSVKLKNGTKLHDNFHLFNGETGGRSLVRCKRCGAMLLKQITHDWDIYDGPNHCYDWIPVASEEEADLLNVLLDGEEFENYCRHLRKYNFTYLWTTGESPKIYAIEELKMKVMEKYQLQGMDDI